jgi:lipopolysaccharide transport system ATP-binding protein
MSQDLAPEWRRRPRPVGRYTSVAWIPGNFLAEGAFIVSAGLYTNDTGAIHFRERETVAFNVIDSVTGDSARGDWGNSWDGVVRPLLPWSTERSEISDTGIR